MATTVLVAVVYVVLAAVLDVLVAQRLTSQVDRHLASRLKDVRADSSLPSGLSSSQHERDVDDAPIFVWSSGPSGSPSAVSLDAPPLPAHSWDPGHPVTIALGGRTIRLVASPVRNGWLIAGQSLVQVSRIRSILIPIEAVLGACLLLVSYVGALTIGRKAAAPVEEARRRQLEFTGDASHELRTPLTVIEAELDLALSRPRDASSYAATLERVAGESRRMRHIVEDLLWLARVDAERSPPQSGSTDLDEVARRGVARFEAIARSRQIRLRCNGCGDHAHRVDAPEEWIDRLVGVLVDNACRYSGEGGSVSVEVGDRASRVFLRVDDTGPGIPPADRARIFDRFHRGTFQPGGAGLGLAIADSVVQKTGGAWHVSESAGGGARMEISWQRSHR